VVAVTPDGTHVYITNIGSNTVSVIATATNTVVATVPVGIGLAFVAITRDGTLVYVTSITETLLENTFATYA
jgi:YVTN family beta-propeller protein